MQYSLQEWYTLALPLCSNQAVVRKDCGSLEVGLPYVFSVY
jgi:hypothetical protein